MTGLRLHHPAVPGAPRLRARPGASLQMGGEWGTADRGTGEILALRVEVPEVWDAVRIDAPATTTVGELKGRALQALYPDASAPHEFVMKLGGWEIIDEQRTVADVGARSGSIFLLTFRQRRPVRA